MFRTLFTNLEYDISASNNGSNMVFSAALPLREIEKLLFLIIEAHFRKKGR